MPLAVVARGDTADDAVAAAASDSTEATIAKERILDMLKEGPCKHTQTIEAKGSRRAGLARSKETGDESSKGGVLWQTDDLLPAVDTSYTRLQSHRSIHHQSGLAYTVLQQASILKLWEIEILYSHSRRGFCICPTDALALPRFTCSLTSRHTHTQRRTHKRNTTRKGTARHCTIRRRSAQHARPSVSHMSIAHSLHSITYIV